MINQKEIIRNLLYIKNGNLEMPVKSNNIEIEISEDALDALNKHLNICKEIKKALITKKSFNELTISELLNFVMNVEYKHLLNKYGHIQLATLISNILKGNALDFTYLASLYYEQDKKFNEITFKIGVENSFENKELIDFINWFDLCECDTFILKETKTKIYEYK